MTRREALTLMAAGFGGTIFGARRLLAVAASAAEAASISRLPAFDHALLNEIGETIIPTTPDSGGAKAANIAEFMEDIIRVQYDDTEQATFAAGLVQLQQTSRSQFSGREFLRLTSSERHELLVGFDQAKPQPVFYTMLKQLTVWGYFSSEIGATKAMVHAAIPGRFDPIVAITPGTKAWSD
jgi:hypothetical protein